MKIVNSIIFLVSVAIFCTASFLFLMPEAEACAGPYCQNNNDAACTYHAYKDCVGNSVYWVNSCGNSQDLIQICSGSNQICKYGQCIFYYTPTPTPPTPVYINHYRTSCYNKSLYWYDSLGKVQTLYKSCTDENQCTEDSCSGLKCQNTLKCDGTSCAVGSPDYNKYCASSQPTVANLTVTFFSKKDSNAVAWDKTTQIGPNASIYFLAVIQNNLNTPADNVSVLANIPAEVNLIGNLKIDDAANNGDIVSGINISFIPANGSKTITFEGKTQPFTTNGDKQATINISASGASQTDKLTINLNPTSQPAAVSSASASSAFIEFLKRWYLWILVAIVMIFLFIVIFRRLSTNV